MLKTVVIVIAVLIAGVLAFAATRPDTFRVQRSASIKAPPEKVFPLSTTSRVGVPGRRGRTRTPR